MSLDACRAEFELDPDLIYLNHAAVAPWPRRTRDAVCAFAAQNAHQGSAHYPDWLGTEARLRARGARLMGVAAGDLSLVKSTSEGLSMVAWGLSWRAGDEVLVPAGEFPSNRVVWESLRSEGVRIREVDLGADAGAAAQLMAAMGPRTRLLSVSGVQYATGLRLDLEALGAACRARDILFCVDAIQWLGALPFDNRRIGADFIVADGHKWMLGPEGLALFYCRPELRPRLRLFEFGWHMLEHAHDFERRDWRPAPDGRRFECGSPNMLGIHGLEASLSLLEEAGMEAVGAAVLARSEYLVEGASRLRGVRVLTPRPRAARAGIVTVALERTPPEEVFRRLTAAGVQAALRGGGIRFSPHFHTPVSQLDTVLALLARWA